MSSKFLVLLLLLSTVAPKLLANGLPLPYIPRWETVTRYGFENESNVEISAIQEWRGCHFAGTHNPTQGAEIYATCWDTDYDEWFLVGQLPPQHVGISRFFVHNNRLFAGTIDYTVYPPVQNRTSIWMTEDGVTWVPVMNNGFGSSKNAAIRSFGLFNNQVYAGTSHSYSGKIYRSFDGITWEKVENSGMGVPYLTHTWDFVEYMGVLYAGHNTGTISFSESGDNRRWDVFSQNFERPMGSGDGMLKIGDVKALSTFNDYLVAGASDRYKGAIVMAYHPTLTAGQWVMASEAGIIGNNTNNKSIHWLETVPHPADPEEEMLVAGTWGTSGGSIFLSTSTTPPFQWREIGAGGFGSYSMAPHVRQVRKMGPYLYIAMAGKTSNYGSYPGKLYRIYLWDEDE